MSLMEGWFAPGMFAEQIFERMLRVCAANPCQPELRIEALIAWPESVEGVIQMGKYTAETVGDESLYMYREMPNLKDSETRGFGARKLPGYIGPARGCMIVEKESFPEEVGLMRLLSADKGMHLQIVILGIGSHVSMPTRRADFEKSREKIIQALAKNMSRGTVSKELKSVPWNHYIRVSGV